MLAPESLRHWTLPIAALLRGEAPHRVLNAAQDEASALADACVVHGVHGLLYHQLVGAGERWRSLPQAFRERIEHQAKADLVWELAHKAELRAAISALSKAGVTALVMKGTALAYSLYPVPSIRARGDTDLFVREKDVLALCDVLAQLGYVRDTHSQRIGCEVNLTKKDRSDLEHVLDVHWRLSSNEAFAQLCDWEEANRMSIALPKLAPQARSLGYVHALLHACAHRAVHFITPYYVNGRAFLEGNRQIWLYDLRLLVGTLETDDWSSFVALAKGRSVSAVSRHALNAAVDLLGAKVPSWVCKALEHSARPEISAQLLLGSAWRAMWVELQARQGMSERLKFLRDLLVPDRGYMLKKYPGRSGWQLPYLYVRRIVEGVYRRMRQFS